MGPVPPPQGAPGFHRGAQPCYGPPPPQWAGTPPPYIVRAGPMGPPHPGGPPRGSAGPPPCGALPAQQQFYGPPQPPGATVMGPPVGGLAGGYGQSGPYGAQNGSYPGQPRPPWPSSGGYGPGQYPYQPYG